jgi:hypothetical protein
MRYVPGAVLAAGAVTAVGVALLASSSSSAASATARPGASPAAATVGLVSGSHGARQTLTEKGVRFSFNVPANTGWERRISTGQAPRGPISLNKSIMGPQGAEAVIYWTSFPGGDYADPCARTLGRSVGPSVADLAAAVTSASGTRLVRGPADTRLGGRHARHVVVTVRKDVGCDPGFFYAWRDVVGGALFPTTSAGDTIRVWIVAVRGTRLFVAAITTVQADSRLEREVEQIIESIRFG